MPVSAYRTIAVSDASGPLYGGPWLQWPNAQPGMDLDYSLDMTVPLAAVSDVIASVTLSVAPSGSGELQALDMTVQGPLITAQLANGFAGRTYTVQVAVTGVSGRVWTFEVALAVNLPLPIFPYPAPPSVDFGTPIVWTSGVTVFGPAFVGVATGLDATGTTQQTALLLGAAINVFANVPSGAGAILPSTVLSGTIVVQNDTTSDLLVYPPESAAIGSLAVNIPVIVSPGQRLNFSTQSSTTQWYAA